MANKQQIWGQIQFPSKLSDSVAELGPIGHWGPSVVCICIRLCHACVNISSLPWMASNKVIWSWLPTFEPPFVCMCLGRLVWQLVPTRILHACMYMYVEQPRSFVWDLSSILGYCTSYSFLISGSFQLQEAEDVWGFSQLSNLHLNPLFLEAIFW